MLKLTVANLDEVAKELHGEYDKQSDGTFRLKVEGVEDVSGLKTALQTERETAKTLKQQLKSFDGVNVEEYNTLKKGIEDAANKKLLDKGQYESLLEQATKKHDDALLAERGVSAKYKSSLEKRMLKGDAAVALVGAGATPKGVKLLLNEVQQRCKVVEEDGEFHVRVMDGDKALMSKRAGETGYMGLEELALILKAEYPETFNPSGSDGSGKGADKDKGGGGNGVVNKKSDLKTMQAKVEFIKKNGRDVFEALPL